jgi:hypothetical protein
MTTNLLEFHPLANEYPLMTAAELAELADDIAANGQREPVWTYEGKILDGRNRWLACQKGNLPCRVEAYTGDDPHLVATGPRPHIAAKRRVAFLEGSLMAIKLVSQKMVSVTLELALQFRDMQSIRGERDLKSSCCKEQIKLLEDGKLFTLVWGRYKKGGVWHRANGNHTSHEVVACRQATDGSLDDKSARFVETMLTKRGGVWEGGPEDLPRLQDGQLKALCGACRRVWRVQRVPFPRVHKMNQQRAKYPLPGLNVSQAPYLRRRCLSQDGAPKSRG